MSSRSLASTAVLLLSLVGCSSLHQSKGDQWLQRQEQLELQVQQLEQRLNRLQHSPGQGGASNAGKIPAGPIKSVTYRSGTSDDRLRIYWADGSVSDLPCTREQNTLACG
jgi:hypothetical protein